MGRETALAVGHDKAAVLGAKFVRMEVHSRLPLQGVWSLLYGRGPWLLLLLLLGSAQAQLARPDAPESLPDAPSPRSVQGGGDQPQPEDEPLSLRRTPQRLLVDEWGIVRSPTRLRERDLRWLLPLAGASAVALATDTRVMRSVVSRNGDFNGSNETVSAVLRDTFIGVPVLLFGAGEVFQQPHIRDTGLIAGEAMVNAYVTSEAIKYVTLRERPGIADQRGHFFSGDSASDPSFVSGHSIVAWSSASVLASEYSKPWQQIGIYTAATSVSLTRVLAQQHFPSDVLLGAASGWLIGHYVFSAHQRKPSHHHASFSGHSERSRDASAIVRR